MAKFAVQVREIHISTVLVEAENPDDAVERVNNHEGSEISLEYSDTKDPGTWSVQRYDDELGPTGTMFLRDPFTGKYTRKIGA